MSVKRYDAVVNGVETILLLNDEDAKRLGDSVKLRDKAAAAPSNKARTAPNKGRGRKAKPVTPVTPAPTSTPADGASTVAAAGTNTE